MQGKKKVGVTPLYDDSFFKKYQTGSRRSAIEIIPLIIELVHPKSVIDVGCGLGEWLSVFNQNGIQDVLGVDGQWVNRKLLRIPQNLFVQKDLTKPLTLNRRFDLVTSLEVAEHLPIDCAETFVNSLVNLGPAIMFSAAIPLQRGTNHINEQWPDYWANIFKKRGFVAVDAIRQKVWQNTSVEAWYAQNILVFVSQRDLAKYPRLQQAYEETRSEQLSIVHPRIFMERACPTSKKIKDLTKIAQQKIKQSISKSGQNGNS